MVVSSESTIFISARELKDSGDAADPKRSVAAGIGDYRIVTTLCPGGKERMQRLIETVRRGRVDLTSLLTHTSSLDDIRNAYNLFGERRADVLKVAMRP